MIRYLLNEEVFVGLDQFLEDNDLAPEEIAELRALRPGETFHGGGGAAAEWHLTALGRTDNYRNVADVCIDPGPEWTGDGHFCTENTWEWRGSTLARRDRWEDIRNDGHIDACTGVTA